MLNSTKFSEVNLKEIIDDKVPGKIIFRIFFGILIFTMKWFKFKKDGWRRTTEINHRSEESKYIGNLSSVTNSNINYSAPIHEMMNSVKMDLIQIHKSLKFTHYRLIWKRHEAKRVSHNFYDLVLVSFNENSHIITLEIVCHPDQNTLLNDEKETLKKIWIKCFNDSTGISQLRRWPLLRKSFFKENKVRKTGISRGVINEFLNRLEGAWWVTFNKMPDDRIVPLFMQNQENCSLVHLEFNFNSELKYMDIWFKISHILMDGRYAEKLHRKINRTFKSDPNSQPLFLSSRGKRHLRSLSSDGKPIYRTCGFFELQPFNEKNEPIEKQALEFLLFIIWNLRQNKDVGQYKFNIPLNVPELFHDCTTLRFLFLRPSSFNNTSSGFTSFKEFASRQIDSILERKGATYNLVSSSAILPGYINNIGYKLLPEILMGITGHISITLINNMEVIYPTLSDNIETAICVSIKEKPFISITSRKEYTQDLYNEIELITEKYCGNKE